MIRHLVLVRFKADLGEGEVADIFRRLGALRSVLPGMVGFSGGPNVSPEHLAHGFTHAFVCDFANEAARDAYLVHPDHKAVGQDIVTAAEGGLDGLVVIDFRLD